MYNTLKKSVESYLESETPIPNDTFEKCIQALERSLVNPRPPKNQNKRRKFSPICLVDRNKTKAKFELGTLEIPTTNTRRSKRSIESESERRLKLYQLILYYDIIGTRLNEYPATPMREQRLRKFGLLNDLERIYTKTNGTKLTVYKSPPGLPVRVTREEIPMIPFNTDYDDKDTRELVTNPKCEGEEPYWLSLEKKLVIPNSSASAQDIQRAKTSLEEVPDSLRQFFIVKSLGVSVNDILQLKYKFRSIYYTKQEVEKAFENLLQKGIIRSIGKDQLKRYVINNEKFKEFVDDCWNAHNLMKEKMEERWLYDDTVKSPWGFDKNQSKKQDRKIDRRWLEKSNDYKEANRLIIDFHNRRQKLDEISNTSKSEEEKLGAQKQIKLLDDISMIAYKALLNDHMKIILKYDYLAEDLIEMTIYPKLIEEKKLEETKYLSWPESMYVG